MPNPCPNCGLDEGVGRAAFDRWVCARCGALLAFRNLPSVAAIGLAIVGMGAFFWARMHDLQWLRWISHICLLAAMVLGVLPKRLVVRSRGPHCRACHYDLASLPADARCPECGSGRGMFIGERTSSHIAEQDCSAR